MKKRYDNLMKIKLIHMYSLLIISTVIFVMNTMSKIPVPLYGDELSFAEKIPLYHFRMYEFILDSFKQYKFYRILGNPICYIGSYVSNGSPLKLSIIFSFTSLILIYSYSHIIARSIEKKHEMTAALIGIICLSLPFSAYIVIVRAGFHELVTLLLIALSIQLISKYTRVQKISYLYVTAFIYLLSLFIYEASLLMPVFYLIFIVACMKSGNVNRLNLFGFAGLMSAALGIYLASQFSFMQSQPKLSDSIAIYAPYNVGLNYFEQLLRAVLYFAYHVKWSLYYACMNSAEISIFDRILIACITIFTAYAVRKLLLRKDCFPSKEQSVLYIKIGASLFICSFGLWSYYWIFKKSIILPPLYNFLLPAVGMAVDLAGAIFILLRWRNHSHVSVVLITLIIVSGFVINIFALLSSRLAIYNTSVDVKKYAAVINETYGSNARYYENIVLLNLPIESGYARRKSRYEYSLVVQLNKLNKNWSNLKVITNVAETDAVGGLIRVSPYKIPAESQNTLILRYNPSDASFVSCSGHDPCTDHSMQLRDPCMISFFGYELSYRPERENIILRKLSLSGT